MGLQIATNWLPATPPSPTIRWTPTRLRTQFHFSLHSLFIFRLGCHYIQLSFQHPFFFACLAILSHITSYAQLTLLLKPPCIDNEKKKQTKKNILHSKMLACSFFLCCGHPNHNESIFTKRKSTKWHQISGKFLLYSIEYKLKKVLHIIAFFFLLRFYIALHLLWSGVVVRSLIKCYFNVYL